MPSYNQADMMNCCLGWHDLSDGATECLVCGAAEDEASAPNATGLAKHHGLILPPSASMVTAQIDPPRDVALAMLEALKLIAEWAWPDCGYGSRIHKLATYTVAAFSADAPVRPIPSAAAGRKLIVPAYLLEESELAHLAEKAGDVGKDRSDPMLVTLASEALSELDDRGSAGMAALERSERARDTVSELLLAALKDAVGILRHYDTKIQPHRTLLADEEWNGVLERCDEAIAAAEGRSNG